MRALVASIYDYMAAEYRFKEATLRFGPAPALEWKMIYARHAMERRIDGYAETKRA